METFIQSLLDQVIAYYIQNCVENIVRLQKEILKRGCLMLTNLKPLSDISFQVKNKH